MLYIVLKNKDPETILDDPEVQKTFFEEYKKSGDTAVLLVSNQVLNIFKDKDLANMCCEALSKDYPNDKFSVGELFLVLSQTDWS